MNITTTPEADRALAGIPNCPTLHDFAAVAAEIIGEDETPGWHAVEVIKYREQFGINASPNLVVMLRRTIHTWRVRLVSRFELEDMKRNPSFGGVKVH